MSACSLQSAKGALTSLPLRHIYGYILIHNVLIPNLVGKGDTPPSQSVAEIARHNFHELANLVVPVLNQGQSYVTGRVLEMLVDVFPYDALIFLIQRSRLPFRGSPGWQTCPPDPTRRLHRPTCRRQSLARFSQDDGQTARHVFQTMVANAFHHDFSAGITHAEPFTGHAPNKGLARGSAVEGHVPDNAVFFRFKLRRPVGVHNQLGPAQAFAEVVIGVAFQFEFNATRAERAEALPRRTP